MSLALIFVYDDFHLHLHGNRNSLGNFAQNSSTGRAVGARYFNRRTNKLVTARRDIGEIDAFEQHQTAI